MSTNEIDSGIMKLGAYGTPGVPWSDCGRTDIKEIRVCHRDTGGILFVDFVYMEEDGRCVWVKHGIRNLLFSFSHIIFDSDEHITRVYGCQSVDNNDNPNNLLSFGIDTNKKSYPFGGVSGELNPNNLLRFSYDIPKELFKGFHGTIDGNHLTGIGVFVKNCLNSINATHK